MRYISRGYDKVIDTGNKILDPSEGHIHSDVIVLGWSDGLTAWLYRKSIRHFTDVALMKRMQKLQHFPDYFTKRCDICKYNVRNSLLFIKAAA